MQVLEVEPETVDKVLGLSGCRNLFSLSSTLQTNLPVWEIPLLWGMSERGNSMGNQCCLHTLSVVAEVCTLLRAFYFLFVLHAFFIGV